MPGPAELSSQLLLAGPTASGKSATALILAQKCGAEIISVDSMQVYRGLDVGTAKPSMTERAIVPHHLIDVADCRESFDAARFVGLAEVAIEQIVRRNRRALLCGGTGLYFKALLDGLGSGPPSDPALRQKLEQTPLESLLAELAAGDPTTFRKIDQRNPRRVIRAVEILRLTGEPPSTQRAAWSNAAPSSDGATGRVVFVLRRQPDDLRARIDARVDQMFAGGLVVETERLLAQGLAENRTAMQAIGYRQVVEHLQGVRSLDATRALIKTKTHQFARRQMTWFRRQLLVQWIDVGPQESADVVAARIQESFERNARRD